MKVEVLPDKSLCLVTDEAEIIQCPLIELPVKLTLSGLRLQESYQLTCETNQETLCRDNETCITASYNDFALSSIKKSDIYENDNGFELAREISDYLKIILGNGSLVKRDVQKIGVKIHPQSKARESKNSFFEFGHKGFLSFCYANVSVPRALYKELMNDIKNGSLISIEISTNISGYDLGWENGIKYAGFVIENGASVFARDVQLTHSRYQEDLLPYLMSIERMVESLVESSKEHDKQKEDDCDVIT